MEKIILIIALSIIFISNSNAQYLQYKNTSITINIEGINTNNNQINYSINANLIDIDTLIKIFTNKPFLIKNNSIKRIGVIKFSLLEKYNDSIISKAISSDQNLSLKKIHIDLIYNKNLLKLNLKNWYIKQD